MADYTEKLNLEKPVDVEFYDIQVFNENADKIDAAFAAADEHSSVLDKIIYVDPVNYGTSLPQGAADGRLFFLLDEE